MYGSITLHNKSHCLNNRENTQKSPTELYTLQNTTWLINYIVPSLLNALLSFFKFYFTFWHFNNICNNIDSNNNNNYYNNNENNSK